MRSSAQNRLTAVGRLVRRCAVASPKARRIDAASLVPRDRAPITAPYAAAMPMAGAPGPVEP